MFLHILEFDEQKIFSRAAWMLIHLDNDVDAREEALFDELHAELGVERRPALVTRDAALQSLRVIESPTVARVLLLELAGIATADDMIHEEESKFLTDAASVMRIEDGYVREALDFAQRAQAVWLEGRELVLGNRPTH